jgi:hypothetical protein
MAMKTETAIQHFGNKAALARALQIKPPSVYDWGELVPLGRAYELQALTNGALQVDRALYTSAQKAAA